MSVRGNKNNSYDETERKHMLCKKAQQGDVIIRKASGSSILMQEMRAQGANLLDNLLEELQNRNLAEIKTPDLVEKIIKLIAMFVPRPKEEQSEDGETINLGAAQVMDIIGQIGLKEKE